MTSLAKIDEQLSKARRAYESAANDHKAAFEAVDTIASAIDALEAVESPTAEQTADLEKKFAELKTARANVFNLQEKADKAASEVRDVEALRASHQLALQREAELQKPQDRTVQPNSAVNADVSVKPLSAEQVDHDIVGWFRGMYLSRKDSVPLREIFAGKDQYANYRNDVCLRPSVYLAMPVSFLRTKQLA